MTKAEIVSGLSIFLDDIEIFRNDFTGEPILIKHITLFHPESLDGNRSDKSAILLS